MSNLTLAPPSRAMQLNQKLLIPVSLYKSLQINLTELIHQLQIALRQRPATMRDLLSLYQLILKTKETIEKQVKKTSLPIIKYRENTKEEKPNQIKELLTKDRGKLLEGLKQLNFNLKAWALLQPKIPSAEKNNQVIEKIQINLALITSFIYGNLPAFYSGHQQDFEPANIHLKAG